MVSIPYRFYQQQVAHDPAFRATVEASLMLVAHEVLGEDPATHGHAQRRGIAESLFQGAEGEIARLIRIFAWRAVFDPAIQAVVFDVAAQEVTPDRVDDADLDRVVREFWDTAAGVQPPAAVPESGREGWGMEDGIEGVAMVPDEERGS